MSDLFPKTGHENNIAYRAEAIASELRAVTAAASDLARQARQVLQRESDAENRLEYVQAAFWYCVANGHDRKTLSIWADALGIEGGQWTNYAYVQLEIEKRGITIEPKQEALPPAE